MHGYPLISVHSPFVPVPDLAMDSAPMVPEKSTPPSLENPSPPVSGPSTLAEQLETKLSPMQVRAQPLRGQTKWWWW